MAHWHEGHAGIFLWRGTIGTAQPKLTRSSGYPPSKLHVSLIISFPPLPSLFLSGRKFLVNCPNLLVDIDILQVVEMSFALPFQMPVKALDGCLLSSGLFILRERVPCRGVEDVAPLTGKPLQVVGDVDMGNGCGIARLSLGLLLFPAGIQKLD